MKKTLFLALVAGTVVTFTSCKENKPAEQAAVESEAAQSEPETSITAIEQFLIDSIAPGYAKAQYSIPCVIASDTDESNPDETLVWGDFWVFNYDIAGDTLKTVSGGSHPGLMHVKRVDGHLQVTAFDQVGDGSNFTPTAKKIFGDKFDAFLKLHADEKAREELRAKAIAAYVKSHNLPVTLYQDFGWPAIAIPAEK